MMNAINRAALVESMRQCNQTEGMTILQHGEMVRDYYQDLIAHIRDGAPLRYEWRLPEWIADPLLLEDLPSDAIMAEYHVFHDVVINTSP